MSKPMFSDAQIGAYCTSKGWFSGPYGPLSLSLSLSYSLARSIFLFLFYLLFVLFSYYDITISTANKPRSRRGTDERVVKFPRPTIPITVSSSH